MMEYESGERCHRICIYEYKLLIKNAVALSMRYMSDM
jgi:hypothetical protein